MQQTFKTMMWCLAVPLAVLMSGCNPDDDHGPAAGARDTAPPSVVSTIPTAGATGVALNRNLTATFNEAMDATTITIATFTLTQGGTTVPGVVTYVGTVATFDPTSNLAAGTLYAATVTTGAKDQASNALAVNKTWSFTTGTTADNTAPTVSSTVPAPAATGVATNGNIVANFSEAMDVATITTATFTLTQGGTTVPGAVTYVGTVATFDPTSDLAASTLSTATVTTGVKDLAGNPLAVNKTWSFTTGTGPAASLAPVNLGTAGNFAILSKSGITNVPTSAVTGHIGVSPIDATAIVGFPLTLDASGTFATSSPQLVGRAYAANYTSPTPANLTTAVSDMETAFTDAAGRPTPSYTELGAGDISGLTLVPGLYKWGTGVLMSTDVTLNGGPNDIWIFQIAGGITQASGARILLPGGALPKNIFWQTFGPVALNTTAHLEGIVLSQTEITLATGATVNGRLLSQTAITLDSSTITEPAP